MTEEPNTLMLRFHRKNIIREDESTVMIQVDDAIGFLEQVIKAFVSPNMAVVRMEGGGTEDKLMCSDCIAKEVKR